MARARVLAAPCLTGSDGNRDALPTVIIEAMALGLPVVATPVGGIPEMVSDGREGLIVAERDTEALVGALDRMLADDTAWASWSANGPLTARARFDQRTTIVRLAAELAVSPQVQIGGVACDTTPAEVVDRRALESEG